MSSLLSSSSLSRKFVIWFIPVLFVGLSIFFSIIEFRYYHVQIEKRLENLENFVRSHSQNLARSMSDSNVSKIDNLLSDLEFNLDMGSIAIYAPSGEVVSFSGHYEQPPQDPKFRISIPLILTNDAEISYVGRAVVNFELNYLQQEMGVRIRNDAFVLFAIIALITISTLAVLRYNISSPLKRFRSAIEASRLEGGWHRVEWKSGDELGQVITSYNELLDQKVAAENELIKHKEKLEATVISRTNEIAERKNLLEAVLGSLTQGVVAFDSELKLIAWNSNFMTLRGYPENLAKPGTSFSTFMDLDLQRGEFLPGDEEMSLQKQIDRAMKFEAHYFERKRPDGSYVEVRGGPIPGGGFVSTYTDVTDRRLMEDQLLEAKKTAEQTSHRLADQNQQLVEAVQLREEVDRITQHDLKSPLNIIVGVPQILLLSHQYNDKERDLIQGIESAGRRMLDMINMSLDLYKMEQNTYHYNPARVDLVSIVRDVLSELDLAANDKKLEFKLLIEGTAPNKGQTVQAMAEELLCYSMFANLIKNAVEASPVEGEIVINLEFADDKIGVFIKNAGEVPLSIQDRFFDKMITEGKSGGTGLGTYSARKMAETQLGHIALDASKPGYTTVRVFLPVS